MSHPRLALTLVEVLVVLVMLLAGLTVVRGLLDPLASSARQQASAIVAARLRTVAEGHTTCVTPERAIASVRLPSRGLAFTPDGLPRTCDGGGVGNTTILLEHRGRQAAVIVSALGRVRWELR